MSITSATYFYIEPAALSLTKAEVATFVYDQEAVATQLTELVAERAFTPKRGDIIGIEPEEERYRNNNSFIFDGAKVIPLSSEVMIDGSGYLPPSIQVSDTEFSICHWRDTVSHSIFWLAQPILDYMTVYWNRELRLYIGSTTIGGRPFACIFRPMNEKYLTGIMRGSNTPSLESPAKVLADLRDGKYYFSLNDGDLDCIDWDYQTDRMFYAIHKERVLYDWCEEAEDAEEGGPEEAEGAKEAEADATSALNTAFIDDEHKEE